MVLFSHFFLALAQANQARISKAFATFGRMVGIARRNDDSASLAKVHNSIGWIYRELEAIDLSLAENQKGLLIARKAGVQEAEINSMINLGWDQALAQSFRESHRNFDRVEALLMRDDWLRWRFEMRLEACLLYTSDAADE